MDSVANMLNEKIKKANWNEKMRILRTVHNYSQKEFAEKCIITEKCVWSWEAGTSIPSNRNKKIIAAVLGVDVKAIFG